MTIPQPVTLAQVQRELATLRMKIQSLRGLLIRTHPKPTPTGIELPAPEWTRLKASLDSLTSLVP